MGGDEFNVLKKYLEKEEFTNKYLQEELELAQHYLPPPEFEEIKPITFTLTLAYYHLKIRMTPGKKKVARARIARPTAAVLFFLSQLCFANVNT